MDSKQIWLTILISLIAALIVSLIVVGLTSKPQLAPAKGGDTSFYTPPQMPDLIISDMNYRVMGVGNSSNNTYYNVEIKAYVKNIGNANAGNSYTGIGVSGTNHTMIAVSTMPLSPGQTTNVSAYFLLTLGYYEGISYADEFQMVNESNEYNNFGNITFWLP